MFEPPTKSVRVTVAKPLPTGRQAFRSTSENDLEAGLSVKKLVWKSEARNMKLDLSEHQESRTSIDTSFDTDKLFLRLYAMQASDTSIVTMTAGPDLCFLT
jgi:hypothetical protein